jgi:hypothetical protein
MDPPRRSGPLTPLLLRMLAADPRNRPHMERVVRELRALHGRLARDSATMPVVASEAERTTRDLANPRPSSRTLALPPAAGAAEPIPPPSAPPRAPVQPPPPDERDPDRGRRRKWPLVAALAAAAVIAGVIAAVALTSGGSTPGAPSTPAAGRRHITTTPARHRSTPTAQTHAGERHTHSAAAQRSSSTPPPRTGATAQQLRTALVDYYHLLPGDTADAWPLLTTAYQNSTARSRSYYDSFWGQFRAVSVSDVSARPPGTVVATITYTRNDGSTTSERTVFGLVRQDAQLKINSSYVRSST